MQTSTTGTQLIDAQAWQTADSEYYKVAKDGGMIQLKRDDRGGTDIPIFLVLQAGEYTASVNSGFLLQIIKDGADLVSLSYVNNYKATFTLDKSATVGMRVYEYPATNIYPSSVAYPMINSGSTAKPWEPYTGGMPSPSPDYPQEIVTAGSDGDIDITVSDGADQSQQLSISTPNGLPGIPVASGGNFTDEMGQQWICDEVDFEKGVYVQRISQVEFDGSSDELWKMLTNTIVKRNFFWIILEKAALRNNQDDNVLLCQAFTYMKYGYNQPSGNNTVSFQSNDLNLACSTTLFNSVDDWRQYLNGNTMTLIYAIATPIETPLSEEELAAYAALRSYNGTTVISTDEDVSGMSAKVVTDVISKNAWFDPFSELASYYKALAGFASLEDLPMPHSRESSLVRKLLDSSYELGFTVTENSSRNERYLWDLINGTTSMLANVPKSDTEKFLHLMIGGTVEEYPVVDTELDYWMDKCVNYMSSNGSIGG